MEIFAAGNKYKLLDGEMPTLIESCYFVFARHTHVIRYHYYWLVMAACGRASYDDCSTA